MKSFSYIPNTAEDRTRMLGSMELSSVEELFADIPAAVRLDRPMNLPASSSEWELMRELKELAGRNVHVEDAVSFLGAGAYHHFIPSVVDAVIGRSEFYTAYTPYQPEISQGILQAIFEYQTLVANLLGMEVSNASVYDGATALGEAALMACSHTRRRRILVARTVHPDHRAVLRTYASGQAVTVAEIAMTDGQLSLPDLERELSDDTAAVIIQYPNFFGSVEDVRDIAQRAHARGALLIVSAYPIALGLLEAPGSLGADIAVAEGQSLGNSLSFGGPYLGVMATTSALMRRLPGRIAGQTKDRAGRRGFVLTLQAREQHIRREKASSNICSNQALNALAASVYLSCMGPGGLREVARQCLAKARYAAERFTRAGAELAFASPYFNEFVLRLGPKSTQIVSALASEGIYFGVPLGEYYPELGEHVLAAVTEVMPKAAIDHAAERLEAMM